ncbi:hypothetical protein CR513_02958, partial [Mucuna pruriens]
MGFNGLPSSRMPITSSPSRRNAKELEWPSTEDMRCPSNPFFSAKSLMYGVLTLWVHFLSPMVILTFCLPSIMFRDRWKLKPPKQMMQKLLWISFGVLEALIIDQGSHFYNRTMSTLLEKYGVVHRVAIAYHPKTNGQAEVFNREIKQLLQKMANHSRNDSSRLLEDALWAHKTTYQTPLEMSPYWIVDKLCSVVTSSILGDKKYNMAFYQAGKERKIQLQELEELRLEAYENSRIYKKKVKCFHDNMILRKEFRVSQKVLLFNSQLKLIAIEIRDEATNKTFKVNGHQLNLFHEGPTMMEGDVESFTLIKLAIPTIHKNTA